MWQVTGLIGHQWPVDNPPSAESMQPLGTFVAYRIHSSLSSFFIEDWDFFEKSIYISAILLSAFTFLHVYTQKPKNTYFILFSY
jgi:hypothetical protein